MANTSYNVSQKPIDDIIACLEKEYIKREKMLPQWANDDKYGWTHTKVAHDLQCFRDAINILKWNKGAKKSFELMLK